MTQQQIEHRHAQRHGDRTPEQCHWCHRAAAICRRKIRLATREEAEAWADEFNVSRGWSPPVVRYRCIWCDGWHLTSQMTRRRQGRVERARRKWLIEKEIDRRAAGDTAPAPRRLP